MKIERVLIIGATTPAGRHIPHAVQELGYQAHVLVTPAEMRSQLTEERARIEALTRADVVIHACDPDDGAKLVRVCSAVQMVICVAGALTSDAERRLIDAIRRASPVDRFAASGPRETVAKRIACEVPLVDHEVTSQSNETGEKTMSNATETIRAFLTNVFDAEGIHVSKIDDYFAPDCVFHDAMPGLEGVEGYKTLMGMFETSTETQGGPKQTNIIGEGDLVSIRWTHDVKHVGELMGVPATGRVISTKGHETYRVQNGKIVENWGIMDVAGLMAQLTAE